MKNRKNILRLTISALCLALSYVLPFITLSSPQLGQMLLLMHIPVLLCGFLCGWQWGLGVGFIAPLLRSLTLGAPVLFPSALCMAFELATYGAVAGLMHKLLPRKKPYIYLSLVISMLSGRVVWGIAMAICLSGGNGFTFGAFISGAITGAIPGIIIQILLVPILVMALDNKRVLKLNDDL